MKDQIRNHIFVKLKWVLLFLLSVRRVNRLRLHAAGRVALLFALYAVSAAAQPQYLPFYSTQPASGGGGGDYTNGLTTYWKLDESGGTVTAVDAQGVVSLTANTASWVAGCKNNAYQGDGTSTFYITGDHAAVTGLNPGTGDFTVNVLVKTTATVSGGAGIVSKWRGNGEMGRYTIAIVGNQLGAYLEMSGSNLKVVQTSETAINDGNCHMITLVAHRTGNLELWVDRTSRGTPLDISSDAGQNYQPDDNFLIGAYGNVFGSGADTSSFFNGTLDEVREYIGRAFNSADINALATFDGIP